MTPVSERMTEGKWIGFGYLLSVFFFNLLFQISGYAQSPQYPMCTRFDELPEEDNFCPRIEGQYPEGCCPAIVGPPKICYYAAYRVRGQPTLINSSYQTCENGTTVSTPCCRPSTSSCYDGLTRRTFFSFVTYRSDESRCCFSLCPGASYWSSHPDVSKQMPGTHHRLGESIPPNLCTNTIINNCTNGGGDCKTSDPCPSPPSRPSPPGPPGPPPSPGPTPGPTPGPAPGPTGPSQPPQVPDVG